MVKDPIKIQTKVRPISNTRKEMMENDNARASKKTFIFTRYVTDKERVEALLANEEKINNFIKKNKPSKQNENNNESKGFHEIRLLNINHGRRNSLQSNGKNKLGWSSLGGYAFHGYPGYTYTETDLNNSMSLMGETENDNNPSNNKPKIAFKRKNLFKIKINNKSESVENHYKKTYFKGISTYVQSEANIVLQQKKEKKPIQDTKNSMEYLKSKANFNPPSKILRKLEILKGKDLLQGKMPNFQSSKEIKNLGDFSKNMITNNVSYEPSAIMKFFPPSSTNIDLINNNALLYTIQTKGSDSEDNYVEYCSALGVGILNTKKKYQGQYNLLKKEVDRERESDEKKKNWVNPSTSQPSRADQERISEERLKRNLDFSKRIEHDDKILVGDRLISKSNEKEIGKQIMRLCNFSSSKHFNNDTRLKVGEGKLMMTNGLSLSQFSSKYQLKL